MAKKEERHAGIGHTCAECSKPHWHTDKQWNFSLNGECLTFDCPHSEGVQNRSRCACKHIKLH